MNRTDKQNDSLHLWFELISQILNDSGKDMRVFLKPEIEIPWTKDNFKNFVWRPVQEHLVGKKSTTELTTKEVSEVYEVLNRFLGEKHGIHVPFPSIDREE